MTNKNLSRKLCEVCGIKYKLYYDSVKFEYVWLTKEEVENCKHKKKLILLKGEEKKEVEKDYPYPKINFEKNNNFLQLEEIMLAELAKHHLTVVKWVHYFEDNKLMHEYILITKTGHKIRFKHNDIQVDNWFVERENRADCLILFVLWKVIPICGEQIKQAIRQADWEV